MIKQLKQLIYLTALLYSAFIHSTETQVKDRSIDLKNAKHISPDIDLSASFGTYQNNSFVISIPFSHDNIYKLKKRSMIYRYRLVYLSTSDLQEPINGAINIGFFANRHEAEELRRDSLFIFPEQTIKQVSRDEHSGVLSFLNIESAVKTPNYYVVAIGADSGNHFDSAAKDILNIARKNFSEEQYEDAAKQYQLLSFLTNDPELASWASELLGLCQEKQKLFSDAIDTYEEILDQYPGATNNARVKQRYLGLTTAASDRFDARQKAKRSSGKTSLFSRGVLGQNYRSYYRSINDEKYDQVLSRIVSDFDFRSSIKWGNNSLKARVNGYNVNDLLNGEDSITQLKRLHLDYQHLSSGLHTTLGRIKDSDSGIFTPYDGVTLSYPILKNIHVTTSAGLPVYFSDIHDDLDRKFISTNISWDTNKRWRFNAYFAHQTLNDVTDRSALGFNSQYFHSRFSSSINVDYDYAFNELNNFLWTSNLSLTGTTQISAVYGYQRSPFLSSSNILIGQPNLDLDFYLSSPENKDNLLDEALERTSLNEYYTINFTHNIDNSLKLSFDYTHSFLSEIPTFDTLGLIETNAETSPTFLHDSFSVQLVKQNFLSKTDTFTLKARGSRSDTSDSNYFYISERMRIGKKFVLQPKLWLIHSKITTRDESQTVWRLSMYSSFSPWPATEFNLEIGGEHISTGIDDNTFGSAYIFAGYRINF